MLQNEVARAVARYLAAADRLLPRKIIGFYVVGSAALGAWRAGRSDIDFVAVVDGGLGEKEFRLLRVLHLAGNVTALGRAVWRADPMVPGTVNGVFVAAEDVSRPVTQIRPLASHSGRTFKRGAGFDVNPVMWKVLLERGIVVRGPAPDRLGLDPEPHRLRAWNLEQLHGYWRSWATMSLAQKAPRKSMVPARRAALARILAPPRLHHTIATGEVIAKEGAGAYALETFAGRWHPLIHAALAYRDAVPVHVNVARPGTVSGDIPQLAGEFTLEVIAHADDL